MYTNSPPGWITTLVALVVDRRWLSLAIVILLAGVVSVGIAKNGVRADFSPQALFTTFVDQQAIDESFSAAFGKTENVAMVVVQAADVTEPRVLQYILEVSRDVEGLAHVERVESIATGALPRSGAEGELRVDAPIRGDTVEPAEAEELRRALTETTLWNGKLVSNDRDTAIVAIFLDAESTRISVLQPVMDDLYARVAARTPPAGVEVMVSGVPHIRSYVVSNLMRDQARLVPLAALVCALLLGLTFRWIPGMVLPNIVVGFCALFLVGGMSWLQEPFNIINQMLPTLLVVIGVNDAIHIVSRYGEEYAATNDRFEAARRTVRSMAVACFLTSFTTAVGFGTLVISHTTILQRFGISAAMAMIMAYVVTMLLLPPLLIIAGKPSKTVLAHQSGWIDRAVSMAMVGSARHAKLAFALSLGVLSLATWSASRVTIDTTLLETFPEETEIHQQIKLLERELDGVLPMEVHFTCPVDGCFDRPDLLNEIDALARWARSQEGIVLSATSYPDVLHEVWVAFTGDPARRDRPFANEAQVAQLSSLLEGADPDPLAPYVSRDRQHLRLNLQVADVGSQRAMVVADAMRGRLDALQIAHPEVTASMTGDAYSGARGLDSLIRDMMSSLGTACIIIFFFLALLLRSVRLGLISILPNITPLILTLAYMTAMGIYLNTTTVIIFSVALGLAVDDTIHVLTRFREEVQRGKSVDEAIALAASGAGRAVVITSIMLVGGLSVMFLSSFVPIRLFAELTAVTIVSCIFGDLIVLPALLKLFWPETKGIAAAAGEQPGAASHLTDVP